MLEARVVEKTQASKSSQPQMTLEKKAKKKNAKKTSSKESAPAGDKRNKPIQKEA